MLGTAPATRTFPTEAANVWGLCHLLRSFPQRTREIAQRAVVEATIQKLNLTLTFPVTADTAGWSPGEGFQVSWNTCSAPPSDQVIPDGAHAELGASQLPLP